MNNKFNSEMLKIARESRNLTQQELADLVDIPQVIISKIEAGIKQIDEVILEQFCRVLRYPQIFFEHDFQMLDMGARLHRKRTSLSKKDENYIDAEASKLNIFISALLAKVDIDVNIPEMQLIEYSSTKKIAEELRRIWDLPKGTISNLTKVLESNGIFICEFDFHVNAFDAVSFYNKKNNFGMILINKNFPPDRQRFTLAHELGHLIMHRNFPSPQAEDEADAFASDFLMPEKDIYEDLENLNFWDLQDLKAIWKVSMAALIYRAKTLECIDDKKYTSFQVRLSQQGYKKLEPPCSLEKEMASLFRDIINYCVNSLEYSEDEIRKLFGLYPEDYRNIFSLSPVNNIKPKKNTSQLKLIQFPS